jgi:hypothetical protein
MEYNEGDIFCEKQIISVDLMEVVEINNFKINLFLYNYVRANWGFCTE